MNISMIGLGKLGMPCAEVIAESGHTVKGFDITTRHSDKIDIVTTIKQAVEQADIVFVAVPTPHDLAYDGKKPTAHLEPKDFFYDIVKNVLEEANQHMTKQQLLVLISTVLPGTTRREFVPIVTNTRFVYNPYLIAMGTVAWDMVNPDIVMIGTEDGSSTGDAKQLIEFYQTIMQNNPSYQVGTWDECECIKVFYNTFISTKIGFVNMIQDVAQRQGNINVDVVTKALTHCEKRIISPAYMKAGMGDGGACHPRDNIALRYMAQQLNIGYDWFASVMNARETQALNLANFLVDLAKQHKLPILINGIAYKPNVAYTEGSYSLLVGSYCADQGIRCLQVDPKAIGTDTKQYRAVVLLAHPDLYVDVTTDSIVVDPWRQHSSADHRVIHYGNSRKS